MPKRMQFFKPKKARPKVLGPSFSKRYGGKAWEATRKRIFARDNWQCVKCGRVCSEKWEAQCDHISRKAESHDDSDDNLQTLCYKCHGKKSLAEKLALREAEKHAKMGVPGGSVLLVLADGQMAPRARTCERLQNSDRGGFRPPLLEENAQ